MTIKIICNKCKVELDVPGALMFSPPDSIDQCRKWHICKTCWNMLLAFLQDNPPIATTSEQGAKYSLKPGWLANDLTLAAKRVKELTGCEQSSSQTDDKKSPEIAALERLITEFEKELAEIPGGHCGESSSEIIVRQREERDLKRILIRLRRYRPTEAKDAWIIWFEDADVKPEVFSGFGAEEAARETFRRRSINWNCHLFKKVE